MQSAPRPGRVDAAGFAFRSSHATLHPGESGDRLHDLHEALAVMVFGVGGRSRARRSRSRSWARSSAQELPDAQFQDGRRIRSARRQDGIVRRRHRAGHALVEERDEPLAGDAVAWALGQRHEHGQRRDELDVQADDRHGAAPGGPRVGLADRSSVTATRRTAVLRCLFAAPSVPKLRACQPAPRARARPIETARSLDRRWSRSPVGTVSGP